MIKNTVKNSDELIIYTGSKGGVKLRADAGNETIWATQDQVADLFDASKQTVSRHLLRIFDEGELKENSVVKEYLTTGPDGKVYSRKFYNLDAIIAVGYRVNSKQATQFRIWATKTLREYLLKGFVANTERIKKLPDKILKDLEEKISFIQRTIQKRELNKSEVDGLLSVIHDYAHSWTYLKEYDEGGLVLKKAAPKARSYSIMNMSGRR